MVLSVSVILLHIISAIADPYKRILLNEMMIHSENENNTHFSITCETETRSLKCK